MKIKILAFVMALLVTNVFAQKEVIKTVFVNQANHTDKSIDQIKLILLKKAKVDAASEIFGDFIKSKVVVENGYLLSNMIVSEKNGIVHLRGEPKYANGTNFGDIQVTITAYATDEDIKSMSIQKITLKNHIYTNENLAIKDLKRAAEDSFILEALSTKKPSIKNTDNRCEIARGLATSFNIEEMDMDVDTSSYIMSGTVEYIPYFLKHKQ